VLIRKADYQKPVITALVSEMLDNLPSTRVSAGALVVLKPNLLMASAPEQGIVTHPMLVRAAAEYYLDRGARVQVSDSPAVSNFSKIVRVAGYNGALDGLDVRIKPFEDSVEVDIGEPFGRVPIARDVIEADLVINLAKLKTHAQMYMSLGVKNMFGCVVGMRKPEWHMRAGVDRRLFARLLIQIHEAIAPAFTLVDGVIALEGQGPGKSGQPRDLGIVVGGDNAHAVDRIICTLLGLNQEDLLTCDLASRMGIFDGTIHVNGDLHIIDDFVFPELNSLSLGPESLNRFMRKYVIQKPVSDNDLCRLCGECWKICPAQAISHNVRGVLFNYDTCIRCYCCVEVCPYAAVRTKEPLLGALRRRLIRPSHLELPGDFDQPGNSK
jgi:uncharacterized protein (DUF362 family)/NAD-dependent dihydropyrimidine dehydrogenase PreA subunit